MFQGLLTASNTSHGSEWLPIKIIFVTVLLKTDRGEENRSEAVSVSTAAAKHQSDQFSSTPMILEGGREAERIMGGRGKRGTGLSWKLLSEAHSWSPWKPVH